MSERIEAAAGPGAAVGVSEPIQIANSPLAELLQQCPRLHLGKNARDWDEVAAWLVERGVEVRAVAAGAGDDPSLTAIEWQAVMDALLFTENHAAIVSDAHGRAHVKVDAFLDRLGAGDLRDQFCIADHHWTSGANSCPECGRGECMTSLRAGDPPEEAPIAMGALQTHAEVIEWGKGIAALVRDTEGWSSDIAWAIRRSIEAYVQAQFDVRIVHLSSGVAADTSPRGAGDRPPAPRDTEIIEAARNAALYVDHASAFCIDADSRDPTCPRCRLELALGAVRPPPRAALTAERLQALLQEARGLSYCRSCDYVGLWETHYAHNQSHHGIGLSYALDNGDPRKAVEVFAAWLLPRLGAASPAAAPPAES